MIKILLTFFMIFFLIIKSNFAGNAQSFQLLVPESHFAVVKHSTTSEQIKYHHRIKYIGLEQTWVKSKVEVITITDGHQYQYCDLAQCFPPQTSSFQSPDAFPMSPGDETSDDELNYIALLPNNIDGTTSLKFSFFLEDNSLDFIEYQVDFIIGTTNINEDFTANSNRNIQAFPNPAANYIFFDISLFDSDFYSEIQIINSMGAIIERISLDSQDNQILYDCSRLPSGAYYYRLISNDNIKGLGIILITG